MFTKQSVLESRIDRNKYTLQFLGIEIKENLILPKLSEIRETPAR